jgi:hypothetical protein
VYDEYGGPSEALIMDWNEHNDHADGFDEPDWDDPFADTARSALAALHGLARVARAEIRPDEAQFLAERRAPYTRYAERAAAEAWARDFHHYGDPPPPLVWQGYADPRPDGTWELAAVAHLGAGVFLGYRRATHPDDEPGTARELFAVIAPCVCAPNRYRHDAVGWLVDLADALDQITGPDPVCAGTCAASLTDHRTPNTGSEGRG